MVRSVGMTADGDGWAWVMVRPYPGCELRRRITTSTAQYGSPLGLSAGRLQWAMPAAVSRRGQPDAHSGTAMLACTPLEAHRNQGSTRRSRATLYAYKRSKAYVGQLLHPNTE